MTCPNFPVNDLGGSAALSDQLANAWPAAGVRAAFVSGGARPFVASCLRLVISLYLATGTRAGVNATAPRPGLVLALVWPAKERGRRADRDASAGVSRSRGGPAANDRDLIAGIQAAASFVVPAPVNPRRLLGAGIAAAGVFRMSW